MVKSTWLFVNYTGLGSWSRSPSYTLTPDVRAAWGLDTRCPSSCERCHISSSGCETRPLPPSLDAQLILSKTLLISSVPMSGLHKQKTHVHACPNTHTHTHIPERVMYCTLTSPCMWWMQLMELAQKTQVPIVISAQRNAAKAHQGWSEAVLTSSTCII